MKGGKKMNCRICNNDQTAEVYNGPIRDGSFGKVTKDNYSVILCRNCGVRFLNPFPADLKNFYETEKYRLNYNNSKEVQSFQQSYDNDQLYKLQKIGLENIRGKEIADFGAGGGSFLDSVVGYAGKTIAVEPAKIYHPSLAEKHEVFSYGKDLVKFGTKIDIGVSFDVLEHVDDPKQYLTEIFQSLNKKGKIYLLTPNSEDILFDIDPENFNPFNYRTAHLFYFSENSLKFVAKATGYKKIKISFIHKYDISNLLMWLKEKRPTGKNKYQFFNEDYNSIYCQYLENNKRSSHVWLEAEK